MVPVDAYCLKGSLLAAVWAQDIIILSGKLNIWPGVHSESSEALIVILGEDNLLVRIADLFLVNSGRSDSLRRLWLRFLHVMDLYGVFSASHLKYIMILFFVERTSIRREIRITFRFSNPSVHRHLILFQLLFLLFRYFQEIVSRFQNGDIIRLRPRTYARLWAALLSEILSVALIGRLHRLDRVYLKLLPSLNYWGCLLFWLSLWSHFVQRHGVKAHATHTKSICHCFLIVLVDRFYCLRYWLAHGCVRSCLLLLLILVE